MAKKFKDLVEKMSPAARARAEAKTRALLAVMHLGELRRARELSQDQLAQSLGIDQSAISKMERRTDMYVSTLRHFIQAMGGDLEIIARFREGDIKINLFEELAEPGDRRQGARRAEDRPLLDAQ